MEKIQAWSEQDSIQNIYSELMKKFCPKAYVIQIDIQIPYYNVILKI